MYSLLRGTHEASPRAQSLSAHKENCSDLASHSSDSDYPMPPDHLGSRCWATTAGRSGTSCHSGYHQMPFRRAQVLPTGGDCSLVCEWRHTLGQTGNAVSGREWTPTHSTRSNEAIGSHPTHPADHRRDGQRSAVYGSNLHDRPTTWQSVLCMVEGHLRAGHAVLHPGGKKGRCTRMPGQTKYMPS